MQRAAHGEVGVRGGATGLRVQRRGRQPHLRHEERGDDGLETSDAKITRLLFRSVLVAASSPASTSTRIPVPAATLSTAVAAGIGANFSLYLNHLP